MIEMARVFETFEHAQLSPELSRAKLTLCTILVDRIMCPDFTEIRALMFFYMVRILMLIAQPNDGMRISTIASCGAYKFDHKTCLPTDQWIMRVYRLVEPLSASQVDTASVIKCMAVTLKHRLDYEQMNDDNNGDSDGDDNN